jgi:carboxyl-terminal processing protease
VHIIAKPSSDEITSAVQELQSRGASAFILDLRSNSGGLVDAGVDIARLFLKSGTVIEQQYRGQAVTAYQIERIGPLADIPLAVLIDGGTASAAEIVAGALQAQGRAMLIGSPSYGKNTIQLVFDLKDQSSLHVTAARWWVPGHSDQTSGGQITPDIIIPDAETHIQTVLHEAIRQLLH